MGAVEETFDIVKSLLAGSKVTEAKLDGISKQIDATNRRMDDMEKHLMVQIQDTNKRIDDLKGSLNIVQRLTKIEQKMSDKS